MLTAGFIWDCTLFPFRQAISEVFYYGAAGEASLGLFFDHLSDLLVHHLLTCDVSCGREWPAPKTPGGHRLASGEQDNRYLRATSI